MILEDSPSKEPMPSTSKDEDFADPTVSVDFLNQSLVSIGDSPIIKNKIGTPSYMQYSKKASLQRPYSYLFIAQMMTISRML